MLHPLILFANTGRVVGCSCFMDCTNNTFYIPHTILSVTTPQKLNEKIYSKLKAYRDVSSSLILNFNAIAQFQEIITSAFNGQINETSYDFILYWTDAKT